MSTLTQYKRYDMSDDDRAYEADVMIDDAKERAAENRVRGAAPDLLAALKNLIEASGHISPLGGEASVKAVRLAGKYMEALENAQAAIAKAEGRT